MVSTKPVTTIVAIATAEVLLRDLRVLTATSLTRPTTLVTVRFLTGDTMKAAIVFHLAATVSVKYDREVSIANICSSCFGPLLSQFSDLDLWDTSHVIY